MDIKWNDEVKISDFIFVFKTNCQPVILCLCPSGTVANRMGNWIRGLAKTLDLV